MALSTIFYSINSPNSSLLSHSVLPTLFLPYWSFQLYIFINVTLKGLRVRGPSQWGAADAEIEVPSGENTDLKHSPFKARSRTVYSHTCYAYCQGLLPCLFLPFRSSHLLFFQNLPRFFLCWLWLTHCSCVGPQNKIGYPARSRFLC